MTIKPHLVSSSVLKWHITDGKSVAVVSGLLATKREAKTKKTTNTKVQRTTFNPELQQYYVIRSSGYKNK